MDIINILKDELGIKRTQAETAVKRGTGKR